MYVVGSYPKCYHVPFKSSNSPIISYLLLILDISFHIPKKLKAAHHRRSTPWLGKKSLLPEASALQNFPSIDRTFPQLPPH